jgi:hypothetical protein
MDPVVELVKKESKRGIIFNQGVVICVCTSFSAWNERTNGSRIGQ